MKKRMLWFALVGILCACSDKSGQKEAPTVKVRTETVRYGSDYRVKPYVGQVEANSSSAVRCWGLFSRMMSKIRAR